MKYDFRNSHFGLPTRFFRHSAKTVLNYILKCLVTLMLRQFLWFREDWCSSMRSMRKLHDLINGFWTFRKRLHYNLTVVENLNLFTKFQRLSKFVIHIMETTSEEDEIYAFFNIDKSVSSCLFVSLLTLLLFFQKRRHARRLWPRTAGSAKSSTPTCTLQRNKKSGPSAPLASSTASTPVTFWLFFKIWSKTW